MRVLVIEDHSLVREGIALAVHSAMGDGGECTFAATGAEALACEREFDLILLDLGLPDMDGIDLLPRLTTKFRLTPILVLSGSKDPDQIGAAFRAGARGYVAKSARTELILEAIRQVLNGATFVAPSEFNPDSPLNRGSSALGVFAKLSPRQTEVLELIAQGLPNKAIADRLGTTEPTIRAHATAIFRILGVRSRTQAMLYYARLAPRRS